jgi:hypothetical protein
MFSAGPEINQFLREWLYRRRLDESAQIRLSLSTPENLSAMRIFRNPMLDADFDERADLVNGLGTRHGPRTDTVHPPSGSETNLDHEVARRIKDIHQVQLDANRAIAQAFGKPWPVQ